MKQKSATGRKEGEGRLMDGYLMGIDVGGTNIKIMIMDGNYQAAAKCSIPT